MERTPNLTKVQDQGYTYNLESEIAYDMSKIESWNMNKVKQLKPNKT